MYNLFKLGKYLDPIAIKNQLLFKFDHQKPIVIQIWSSVCRLKSNVD